MLVTTKSPRNEKNTRICERYLPLFSEHWENLLWLRMVGRVQMMAFRKSGTLRSFRLVFPSATAFVLHEPVNPDPKYERNPKGGQWDKNNIHKECWKEVGEFNLPLWYVQMPGHTQNKEENGHRYAKKQPPESRVRHNPGQPAWPSIFLNAVSPDSI